MRMSVKRKAKVKNKKTKSYLEKRLETRKDQFDLICKKFNFKITNLDDKVLYDTLFHKFSKLRTTKGSKKAKKSVENVDFFKTYCDKYSQKFTLQNFFNNGYDRVNFIEKYPEIKFNTKYKKGKKPKKKNKQSNASLLNGKNQLADFIPEEVMLKLNPDFKKDKPLDKTKESNLIKRKKKNTKKLLQKVNKTKSSPIKQTALTKEESILKFNVDWENVFFEENKILLKHNNRWYQKYIPKCKKHLNKLKHYYKFHNVPKLKIKVKGEEVLIENEEVLFYHIDFLNITASNFFDFKLPKLNIENWARYTKKHYKKHLPFLFHTYTLKKLCEYCDGGLPIIPVGEAVINSSGASTIHDSFLFPIKSKDGYVIVWESIEEGKASYVFSLKSYSNKDLQTVFNYIAGNTHNKRLSLLRSKELQHKLKMKERILHTDYSDWENNIKSLMKKV